MISVAPPTGSLALVFVATLLAAPPVAAQFDPSQLEWIDKEEPTLEFLWKRPKHPKWRAETIEAGNGRKLIDVLIRAESPSASPDMQMIITAWSHEGNYAPQDFPSKSDDELKSIISKDDALKMDAHKEFGNKLVAMFAPGDDGKSKVKQREVLDELISYKKSSKLKSYGKELERIVKLHDKKKYIHEVPLVQGSSGELAKFYLGSCQYEMDRPKVGKITSEKIGQKPFSAKTFRATGLHHRYQAKVTLDYHVFTGITGYTVVCETVYWGGSEKTMEVKYIHQKILDSFDKK